MTARLPQPELFDTPPVKVAAGTAALVGVEVPAEQHDLAQRLGPRVHLGTSSWHFPGWHGVVWGRRYSETTLSRHGLTAYAKHPLLRCVSVDRSFYRAVPASLFAEMAAQVGDDFRFVVKAPAAVADATLRAPSSGQPLQPNPLFLDPATALSTFIEPVIEGLGRQAGALVFQLSPLPARWLRDLPALWARLHDLLQVCRAAMPAPVLLAVEVRDPSLLVPEFAATLKASGARWCLGLHDRMPAIEDQLPMLRAMWPGPLVCRWNLQRGLRYTQAKGLFEPFDRLQAPDPATRKALAQVIAGTVNAGHGALVTINNKAEGCAPLSVLELARELGVQLDAG